MGLKGGAGWRERSGEMSKGWDEENGEREGCGEKGDMGEYREKGVVENVWV